VTTYRVDVDVSQGDPENLIKPLNGVNRGPLRAYRYNMTLEWGLAIDYQLLFVLAGIQSVRTHDSMLDVAHIFRGASGAWPDACTEFKLGVVATPEYLQALVDALWFSSLDEAENNFQAAAWRQQGQGTRPFVFNYGRLREPFNPSGIPPSQGDCWLYWRPSDLSAALAHPTNYDYIDSLAEASYNAIDSCGMEVYFRLGETYHGPAYMGVDEIDASGGKGWYAAAAAEIVAYLAAAAGGVDPPHYPGFIEIINEPDQSGYLGPHDQNPCRLEQDGSWTTMDPTKLTTWCADFSDLYGYCASWLTDRGIPQSSIGGPGVTSDGARDLVLFHNGLGPSDSKVDKLFRKLLSDSPSTVNFLAFHWYGDIDSIEAGASAIEVARAMPGELRAAVEAVHAIDADLPIHVNEWHLSSLGRTGNVDVNAALVGSLGAAFASVGQTVMQHPELGIERAHLYPAYADTNGHFYLRFGQSGGADRFEIRPSAFVARLHAGLEGDVWLPVTIERDLLIGGVQQIVAEDVFEAIDAGHEVVALASHRPATAGQERCSVILTNLGDTPNTVIVRYQGLSSGDHLLRTKQVHQDQPWPVRVPPSASYLPSVRPSISASINAFWTYADIELNPEEGGAGQPVTIDGSGEYEHEVELRGHGVMRVDIVEGWEPERPERGGEPDIDFEIPLQTDPAAPVDQSTGRSWQDHPIDRHLPAGLKIPQRYRDEAEGDAVEAGAWKRGERPPVIQADDQRRFRRCEASMRKQMADNGYTLDEKVSRLFREYFVQVMRRDGRSPDELDESDWYGWFLTHQYRS
jgi:hypothetical protein